MATIGDVQKLNKRYARKRISDEEEKLLTLLRQIIEEEFKGNVRRKRFDELPSSTKLKDKGQKMFEEFKQKFG